MSNSQTAPVAAFAAMALGATFLTVGDLFIKRAAMDGVSIAALLLFAWPITVAGLTAMAYFTGGFRHHLFPQKPGKLAIRALLLLTMTWLTITSLSLNPYSQHAMLFQMSPVFTIVLGVLFLSEKMTLHVGIVLAACLVGAWLIINPGMAGLSSTLLFAVMAALANALTNTFIAANRNAATPLGYTFYAVNGVAIVVGVYWLLLERQVPAFTAQVWIQGSALFSVTGIVFAGLAMLLARGNVGRVSIMLYVQMPVALFLGWLVLGENPTSHSLIGGVIIVVFGASIPLSRNRSSEKAA